MKYLFTILFSAISISSLAQLSIGARLVANYQFSLHRALNGPTKNWGEPATEWDKDLVLSYTLKNWGFEASINHDKKAGFDSYGYYLSEFQTFTDWSENRYSINTAAQYNVWGIGKKKQLRNFIGLSLNPIYTISKERRIVEDANGNVVYYVKGRDVLLMLLPGLHYTLRYSVNRHLLLTGTFFVRYDYEGAMTGIPGAYRDTRLGVGIGASYKITP